MSRNSQIRVGSPEAGQVSGLHFQANSEPIGTGSGIGLAEGAPLRTTRKDGVKQVGAVGAAALFLRLGLAASFLSAVADRFGLYGAPGDPSVAWGNWKLFVDYVAVLNWFAPVSLVPVLAWAATLAEVLLAIALLIGWRLRLSAFASGLLLSSFALTMTIALGIKAPLDYSVFTVAGGAFLLAALSRRT